MASDYVEGPFAPVTRTQSPPVGSRWGKEFFGKGG